VIVCASCGQENPEGFKFCGNCGAPLETSAPAREMRKVVTIVFCDLTGSTALGGRTDPETLRATMRGYYEQMRTILERHGGTVEKFVGDAVMAVFGVPVAHEDDALRAVRAAWEMRTAVPELGLQARIGVNTGEVMTGEGDTLVTGDAVNIAARLEQAAPAGTVLIGDETRRLVRDAVQVEPIEVTAKGKPEPLAAFRLLDVDLEAAAITRRLETPLVGRRDELEQLRQAFDRSVRERRCHLFTVLGPAGVGKSRFVAEFLEDVGLQVVTGRCLDYGEGITYWPVISILKQLGTRADETLARVVEGGTLPNEVPFAVRSLLEEVAAEQPLVVLFDDIQWGEETFLDLVDHIADMSRGAPILLLCVARPELLDKRPGWAGGKLNATTILLEPLGNDECSELIALHGDVDERLRGRILEAAGGNPLFVEEMVAFARDGGDDTVPSTVQALLQARLDQLGGAERSVIERGAVEGQVFHRGAVLELTRTPDVEPQLVGLVRKELIHPVPAVLLGDHAYQFRHLLIRDAAYDALPKETRADLHEQFATWLDRHGQDLIELHEVLGYHLEQAAGYRRELGKPSAADETHAGERLYTAGRRAAERGDAPAALNLLGRAVALLPQDHDSHTTARLDRVALLILSDHAEVRDAAITELLEAEDPVLRMHGTLARLNVDLMVNAEGTVAKVERITDEAIELFTAADDERGLATVWEVRAMAAWLQSRARETIAALDHFSEHAERSDLPIFPGRTDVLRFGPLVHGPFTTTELRERMAALTGHAHAQDILESRISFVEGRYDDTLAVTERGIARVSELGVRVLLAPPMTARAECLAAQGRLPEAAEAWREVIVLLESTGHTSFLSTTLVDFGATLYLLGDLDEAERLAIEGEEMGATDDIINFSRGRRIRAVVAADRGALEQAEELARSALDYAYRTDFPEEHAGTREALGRVLRAAGRTEEARVEYERALATWERYDWGRRAEDVRELLVEL
jgi:class 3 adenylate cyclase/tetratricopeptide (TPR) repeat protein